MSSVADFVIENGVLKQYTGSGGNVTVPEGVTSIGDKASWRCENLTSVIISEGVTSIGYGAFMACKGLASITLPESLTSIGDRAFSSCHSLGSITLPESLTSIGDGVFWGCRTLKNFTLPEGVASIGSSAFYGCRSLVSITIPEGVTIKGSAFMNCESLVSITLPKSMTSIDSGMFNGCRSLKSITLPEGVASIGEGAFWGCGSLKSITLPESLKIIGNDAFKVCTSLKSITLPESVMYIGDSAFDGTAFFYNESNWENNVLYIGKALIEAKELLSGVYAIKKGTKCIADSAFFECRSLKSITLPEGVKSIGNKAFSRCSSLKSITIPDSVTSIGEKAFSYCSRLVEINVAGDNPQYASVDGVLFTKDLSEILSCPEGKKGAYVIPKDVKSIGNESFTFCKLRSITIPKGVTSIGKDAFLGCSLTYLQLPKCIKKASAKDFSSAPIKILCAPGLNIENAGQYKSAAALGFCVLSVRGYLFESKIAEGYEGFIKRNRKKLYPAAVENEEVLAYLIENKIILYNHIEECLKLADESGNVSAKAALLEYKNSAFPDKTGIDGLTLTPLPKRTKTKKP